MPTKAFEFPIILSRRGEALVELCARVALQSAHPSRKFHGAALVKGGAVINTSPNRSGYNNFGARFFSEKTRKPSLHAEIGVVLGIDRKITSGAVVYVVRISNRDNSLVNSKPCSMCQDALAFVGVKRVIYSADNGEFLQMRLA